MIEQSLRKRLQPIVDRRRHLHLAWNLALCWLVWAIVGAGLIGVQGLWGWRSPPAVWILLPATAATSLLAVYRSRRMQPDYRQVARHIEQHHPEIRALLRAAVEQDPAGPDGQFGYLQSEVIREAIRHATSHDWLQAVSPRRLLWADVMAMAALCLVAAVLLQMIPSTSWLTWQGRGVLTAKGYHVTVTPGDAVVESGSPVVVVARFEGRVPPKAVLRFGASGQELQQVALTQTLNDPVYGGILRDIRSDLLYRIEYAGQQTQDYQIQVYESPALTQADARIVYPAYTNRPEKVLRDTRQVGVVEGSQVTWVLTLNKPVATARLVPKAGPAVDLTVDANGSTVYCASITASQSQRYELRLTDAQGRANKIPERIVMDVHKNLPPELRPVFPARDVQVSPLEEVSLEGEVSDDFGISGYGLTYTLAGTPGVDVTLGGAVASKAKQRIQYVLALEDFKVEPGQLLTYSFWADDAGPDGRVRRTASDIYFAEVRPLEEVFRESQSFQDERNPRQDDENQGGQQGQRGEQLARLQKQIISATWNIKQQADRSVGLGDWQKDLEVVRQSQADALRLVDSAQAQAVEPSAAKALQGAARYMQTTLDHLTGASESSSATELTPALGAEQSAYQELLKLRDRQSQVAQGDRNSNRASSNSAQFERQLQQLELQQRENRYETERLARSQERATAREDLQALNRLGDLARRQLDMSDRLREAEASLRQARSEQQRQDILRELKRLRDEQFQSLQDVDELQNRMDRPENRQRMAEARDQLSDSRSGIRQSAEDLDQGRVADAVTSTTRAQRQLDQMRDDLRRQTSGQFVQEMRDMREQAQQLDQRERQIADEVRQQVESGQKTLTDSGATRDLVDRLDQQKEQVQNLVDQMKSVSEQSEASEPLLSQKLYDTLRQVSAGNVDKSLEAASELLRRRFLPQAQEMERQAGAGIEDLRKGVEEAAGSVLGDEAESLRLAQQQLDDLIRQVNDEAARGRARQAQSGRGEGGRQAGDPNASADRPAESQRTVEAQSGNDTQTSGPLTGEAYRPWSDRLREVEEMLTEQNFRNQVARVRDQARAVRAEFTRHGKEPQWDLVEERITQPLAELRRRVNEKLARLRSNEALVPIDRDPVPGRFAEPVRRYFENLGGPE